MLLRIVPALLISAAFAHACAASSIAPGAQGEYFHPQDVAYAPVQLGTVELSVKRTPLRLQLIEQGTTRNIRLDAAVEQIADVKRLDGNLMVLGWMNAGRATDISIYSLETLARLDDFWGYRASISPSGQVIAFVQFYPAHGVTGVQDVVRLYNVKAGSGGNRLDAAGHPLPDPSAEKFEVGTAVYPAVPLGAANVDLADDAAVRVLSALTWLSEARLLFVSQQAGQISLVSASPNGATSVKRLGRACDSGAKGADCLSFTGLPTITTDARGKIVIMDGTRHVADIK